MIRAVEFSNGFHDIAVGPASSSLNRDADPGRLQAVTSVLAKAQAIAERHSGAHARTGLDAAERLREGLGGADPVAELPSREWPAIRVDIAHVPEPQGRSGPVFLAFPVRSSDVQAIAPCFSAAPRPSCRHRSTA